MEESREHAARLFKQTMGQREQAAQVAYTTEPSLRDVAAAVLRQERRVHKQGEDSRATLFFLREHLDSGRLRPARFSLLTNLLHERDEMDIWEPGESLAALAHISELIRRFADGEPNVPMPPDLPPYPLADHGDLVDCGRGHRFHGVGFTSVMLAHTISMPTAPPLELYHLYYAGRDGWSIEVWRIPRVGDEPGARFCIPTSPDSEAPQGRVPESLTRICNAIAANPVPVRVDNG